MIPTQFTNKELKDQELILLHKSIFTKFLIEKQVSFRNRTIADQFYDIKINKDNIRLIYNRHMSIFASALLMDNLQSIVKHSTHSK